MIAPSRNAEAWSRLQILWGELTLTIPGQCTITKHKRKIGCDKPGASGQNGGQQSRKGQPLIPFRSTFFLSDEPWPEDAADAPEGVVVDDFYQWDAAEVLLALAYDSDPPVALTVVHPDLSRQGVVSATVGAIGEMTDRKDGGASVYVEWNQFRPPTPTGGGGSGSGGGGAGIDPQFGQVPLDGGAGGVAGKAGGKSGGSIGAKGGGGDAPEGQSAADDAIEKALEELDKVKAEGANL